MSWADIRAYDLVIMMILREGKDRDSLWSLIVTLLYGLYLRRPGQRDISLFNV